MRAHVSIAFPSALAHCDAADCRARVRCYPLASCANPAREVGVRGALLLRFEGKYPLQRRHTDGQQKLKD